MTKTIHEALCKAQSQMKAAKKDKKNPYFNSSYSDLASVFDAIREPFAENGLAVTQTVEILESGHQALCTALLHVSGDRIESKMLLPHEQNPQKLGSLMTYYRRYSLMAIAGLPAEDDDGNEAAKTQYKKADTLTPVMAKKLRENLSRFPEYQAEVNAYLERQKLSLETLPLEHALRISAKVNAMLEANNESV